MRWFGWFRRDSETALDIKPINVDALVRVGLRDRASAETSLGLLTQKRKEIQRGLRVLDKRADRLTPAKVRNIARSGSGQIGPYQLSQHMQQTNARYQDSAWGGQVATLERQLRVVEGAITSLKEHSRSARK